MAIPTNTRETYGAVGIREDLSNIIYNISPTETPFLSGCGRETAENTYFSLQSPPETVYLAITDSSKKGYLVTVGIMLQIISHFI